MTKEGIKNAQIIAQKLKKKKINVAYSSSLSRSKRTLKEVLKYHPECKSVTVDNGIIERNYGKLQRHSHREFIDDMQDLVMDALEQKYGEMKECRKCGLGESVAQTIYNTFHRSYTIPPPGGESIKEVEVRVKSFIKDLLRRIKKEKVHVAISAHGNSMRPFRRYFEKLSVKQMMELENPWDNYFEYEVEC